MRASPLPFEKNGNFCCTFNLALLWQKHKTLFLSEHVVANYVVWIYLHFSVADLIPISGLFEVRFLSEICVLFHIRISIYYCSMLDVQTLIYVRVRIDGLFPHSFVSGWLVEPSND
jgi:hypothetical protein